MVRPPVLNLVMWSSSQFTALALQPGNTQYSSRINSLVFMALVTRWTSGAASRGWLLMGSTITR